MPFVSPTVLVKQSVQAVQDYSLLTGRAVANVFTGPHYWDDVFTQMDSIGVGSMPIVILTGFFTGCVLALQSASSLEAFGAISMTGTLVALSMVKELGPVLTGFFTGCVLALQSASSLEAFGAISMTGTLVALSMVKELGPVLTGLMISGRNASGMASELGSMKVSEQIDAMRALGTDPTRKLVTPRLIATVFMLFFLTIVSDAVGIAGGALVSVSLLGLNLSAYYHSSYRSLTYAGLTQGLVKPLFSGFIIATVGCYYGMNTKGGTQGVGKATTQAVVVSSVAIIIVDFLVSRAMIGIFGTQ